MKKLFIIFLILYSCSLFAQNVAINSTGAIPNPSSMLDVSSTNSGMLIPRMTSAQKTAIGGPATGLLVYDTTTSSFWYFDGAIWVELGAGGADAWEILGNANTTSGTNFIGTTNAQALDFRTGNTIRFRVANAYQVHAMSNGTSASPFYSWSSDSDIGMWRSTTNRLNFSTAGIERLELGTTEAVINDVSVDYNFRVESNGQNDMFFVDAGNDRVYVNSLNGGAGDLFSVYNSSTWNGTNPWLINSYNSFTAGGAGFFNNSNAANGFNALEASQSGTYSALFGLHTANSGTGYGVYGVTNSAGGVGVFAKNTAGGIAAYFDVGTYDIVIDYAAGEPSLYPTSNGWGYVGVGGRAWWVTYAYHHVVASKRELKRNIETIDNEFAQVMVNDIRNLKPSIYKYNIETDNLEFGNESKYRPFYHIGLIVDETPDYLQDNTFNGIDLYSLATLNLVGVKHNLENISELKKKINDFGVGEIQTQSNWIEFSNEFIEQLNNSVIPVVTVTSIGSDALLYISEVTSQGFRVETSSNISNIAFNWIAMAKIDPPKMMTAEEINNFKLKNNLSVTESDKIKMNEWGKKKNENAEFYMNQSNKIKGPLKTKQNINAITK